jgi:predicted nucleic-acid-binding protein
VIGIDTNVVVRFLAQDDAVQSPIATRFMSRLSRERPGFISAVVLAEITWVLSRAYKTPRDDIAAAVEGLLRSAELVIENADAAYRALARYQDSKSVEFADALIAQIAMLVGADEVVTFDQSAASELGVRLLR